MMINKKEKILIIHKGQFDNFPPLMSVKNVFNNIGFNVDVLTTNLKDTNLFHLGEKAIVIRNKKRFPILSNLYWYLKYSIRLFILLKDNDYKYKWIEGGDTLALFGWMIKKRQNCVFQLSELYDKVPIYKFLIGLYINRFNKIVVPEINRAYIIKTRYNLSFLPFVLPNKPNYNNDNYIPRKDTISLIDKISNFAAGRKIILYQGLIANDRKFDGIVEFVIQNKTEFCLIILGKDIGYLSSIDRDSQSILYSGFLLPPDHLEVTKLAWVCVLAYDTTSLNKVYCAPNKIWEYTKYNKPMISQNLPGINMIFQEYKIGYCADLMNLLEVETAINKIKTNYIEMSRNTTKYFNSIDVEKEIKRIIKSNNK